MIEEKDGDGEDGDGNGDIVESDRGPSTSTKAPTRRSPVVAPASPALRKRRRLASSRPTRSLTSVTASSGKGPSEAAGRTRSALDVLADQAAVFSSQEHDTASSKGGERGMVKVQAPDTSGIDAESNSIGDSGRQKSPSRNRPPQPRDQSSSRLLSASTSSPSTKPATETILGHGPPPSPASETQRPSSSPKHVPPRSSASASAPPPSTEPPQGTMTNTPKDASPTDSTWTGSAVKSAP
ncbi:hypothetical protein BJY52DRAFT_51582 [Lactarius psammicola]|nr:hypothetical protein BJY52DRAFT_51582 [Lactarius psammicola]